MAAPLPEILWLEEMESRRPSLHTVYGWNRPWHMDIKIKQWNKTRHCLLVLEVGRLMEWWCLMWSISSVLCQRVNLWERGGWGGRVTHHGCCWRDACVGWWRCCVEAGCSAGGCCRWDSWRWCCPCICSSRPAWCYHSLLRSGTQLQKMGNGNK